jgi:hypothetical protein
MTDALTEWCARPSSSGGRAAVCPDVSAHGSEQAAARRLARGRAIAPASSGLRLRSAS